MPPFTTREGKRLKPILRQHAFVLREQGFTYDVIADALKVNRDTIQAWMLDRPWLCVLPKHHHPSGIRAKQRAIAIRDDWYAERERERTVNRRAAAAELRRLGPGGRPSWHLPVRAVGEVHPEVEQLAAEQDRDRRFGDRTGKRPWLRSLQAPLASQDFTLGDTVVAPTGEDDEDDLEALEALMATNGLDRCRRDRVRTLSR